MRTWDALVNDGMPTQGRYTVEAEDAGTAAARAGHQWRSTHGKTGIDSIEVHLHRAPDLRCPDCGMTVAYCPPDYWCKHPKVLLDVEFMGVSITDAAHAGPGTSINLAESWADRLGDATACPDCGDTVRPDDTRCPNEECPSNG